MRIVFWNIRAGGGVRVGRIAAQLERWAPDAVALCEFRATPPSLELAKRSYQKALTLGVEKDEILERRLKE